VTPYQSFMSDKRRENLSEGKLAAIESIMRDVESILNGDQNFPTLWWHIQDKARIAAGFAPNNYWEGDE
jgi:hypothetical protein